MANEVIYKFEIAAQEIEQIMLALAERPFKDVFQLMAKIQQQHVNQISTKPAGQLAAQTGQLAAQIAGMNQ